MKTNFSIVIVAAILVTAISCKSKEQKEAEDYMNKINKTVKENSPSNTDEKQNTSTASANIPQGMESIIGEWELVKFISDKNGNSKIDPEEESAGKLEQPDYLKLNADGTCEYTPVKVPARYAIQIKEDGRKKLAMFDPTGPEITGLTRYIMSVTDKELVVYRVQDSFEIFRRL